MDANKYKILEKLDAGGMAEVFKAEIETIKGFKKIVAIKRIHPELLKDIAYKNMFMDEARLSLYLQHANIASVFDVGMSANHFFIVMEYIEGMNLRAILKYLPSSSLFIQVAVKIISDVCEALDYAHNLTHPETGKHLNIVHRDISPPNILISKQGEVKLVDFGLAKASSQIEKSDPGIIKGKYSYLSPEAASGVEVDHRTDIFAAGIILYELITGKRLFVGEDDYQTVLKVQAAKIPPIISPYGAVPESLKQIIYKSLQRDPDKRYQTAGQMYEDLTQFLFSYGKPVTKKDISELVIIAEKQKQAIRKSPQAVSDSKTKSHLKSKSHKSKTSSITSMVEDELQNMVSLGEVVAIQEDPFSAPGAEPIVWDSLSSSTVLEKFTPSGIKQVNQSAIPEKISSDKSTMISEPISFMKEDSSSIDVKTILLFVSAFVVILAVVYFLFT